MGSYLYAYAKKEKTMPVKHDAGLPVTIGIVRYVCKPGVVGFGSSLAGYTSGLITRFENQNKDRKLPSFVCVNEIKEGADVFNMSMRQDFFTKSYVEPTATFYDDPYGFGPHVGQIVKIGNKYHLEYNTDYAINMI